MQDHPEKQRVLLVVKHNHKATLVPVVMVGLVSSRSTSWQCRPTTAALEAPAATLLPQKCSLRAEGAAVAAAGALSAALARKQRSRGLTGASTSAKNKRYI
jgi:hypothetical protein